MIVALETSNKIKEANENSEEISTGRKMSKLYFSCLLFQVRNDIYGSINWLEYFYKLDKELTFANIIQAQLIHEHL